MGTVAPLVVTDPLAFALRSRGGVARVWNALLPRFLQADVDLRFTCGATAADAFGDGYEVGLRRLEARYRLPATVRRFVPYAGRQGVFFPTYFRPCGPGVPNIQLVHDCIKELYYPLGKQVLARMRRSQLYRNATKLIAISESTRLDLIRLHGEAIEERIEVIYNPVDYERIHRCATQEVPTEDYGRVTAWIDTRPFVMFIGYRAGVKNFRQVRHLLAALVDHVVVAVGDPPTAEEKRLADDCGGRICYAGPLGDVAMFRLLKQSEFLFFPSTLEGFGLPIVESLLLGTPVMGLDTQTNRDVSLGLVEPFEGGSHASIKAAAARMERLEDGDPRRLRLVERYDPDAVAARYIEAIKATFSASKP